MLIMMSRGDDLIDGLGKVTLKDLPYTVEWSLMLSDHTSYWAGKFNSNTNALSCTEPKHNITCMYLLPEKEGGVQRLLIR